MAVTKTHPIKSTLKAAMLPKQKRCGKIRKSGLSSILKTVSKPNSRRAMNGGQKSII